jgi:BolA protein
MMAASLESIRQRLASLRPDELRLEDESHLHAGHEGAKSGGGHFRLSIVSNRFNGLGTVARHRLVYDALADLMRREIHALSIHAATPDEARHAAPNPPIQDKP